MDATISLNLPTRVRGFSLTRALVSFCSIAQSDTNNRLGKWHHYSRKSLMAGLRRWVGNCKTLPHKTDCVLTYKYFKVLNVFYQFFINGKNVLKPIPKWYDNNIYLLTKFVNRELLLRRNGMPALRLKHIVTVAPFLF